MQHSTGCTSVIILQHQRYYYTAGCLRLRFDWYIRIRRFYIISGFTDFILYQDSQILYLCRAPLLFLVSRAPCCSVSMQKHQLGFLYRTAPAALVPLLHEHRCFARWLLFLSTVTAATPCHVRLGLPTLVAVAGHRYRCDAPSPSYSMLHLSLRRHGALAAGVPR